MPPIPPTRLELRLFAEGDNAGVALGDAIGIFQQWIQQQALPGLWLDVADYRHVVDGPGILLVGHSADLSLGTLDGQLGLSATRKRDHAADWPTQLRELSSLLHQASSLLSQALPLRWQNDQLLLRVLDRLRAPNTDDSLQALAPTLDASLPGLLSWQSLQLQRQADARRPLTVLATPRQPAA